MKKSDMFQSSTMKAEDFQVGDKSTYQIEGCVENSYWRDGKTEKRACLKLKNEDQLFSLNRGNWEYIEDALVREDSDDWVGAWIEVEVVTVKYMGKNVNGFKVTRAAFPKGTVSDKGQKKEKARKEEKPKQENTDADPVDNGYPF